MKPSSDLSGSSWPQLQAHPDELPLQQLQQSMRREDRLAPTFGLSLDTEEGVKGWLEWGVRGHDFLFHFH